MKLILKTDYRTQDGRFFKKGDDVSENINGTQKSWLLKNNHAVESDGSKEEADKPPVTEEFIKTAQELIVSAEKHLTETEDGEKKDILFKAIENLKEGIELKDQEIVDQCSKVVNEAISELNKDKF